MKYDEYKAKIQPPFLPLKNLSENVHTQQDYTPPFIIRFFYFQFKNYFHKCKLAKEI